ncbi:hypothetical protein K450DRAFT_181763 [Umbelopsis ramanniana AG]|uniref:Ubiquitin-like protease family profile domain-containing protein n=1 Tax=Umbelopsis ramanniana AG TaxID=1314678 RepID=A0AAD5EJZ4_UMBRA|nr:uncharacterized protein K450DRAFT_181763 [Umbelopsis ramanniana AG]KAI8584570.1 hypothetical protein K450DRAFT_181763 [Umbelopsis ramanniana AG]
MDKIVSQYGDVVLRKSDYDTLADGQWLNDTVIEFHTEYLEREIIPRDAKILILRPATVHLISHIQDTSQLHSALPPNLNQSLAIFIPINDGKPHIANSGSHWSLLVYLRATSTFYYYDSLHNANINSARLTARRLTPLLGLRIVPHFVSMWTPPQPNGADCGICVIAITDFLVEKILSFRRVAVNPWQLMQISPQDLPSTRTIRKGLRTMIKDLARK